MPKENNWVVIMCLIVIIVSGFLSRVFAARIWKKKLFSFTVYDCCNVRMPVEFLTCYWQRLVTAVSENCQWQPTEAWLAFCKDEFIDENFINLSCQFGCYHFEHSRQCWLVDANRFRSSIHSWRAEIKCARGCKDHRYELRENRHALRRSQ